MRLIYGRALLILLIITVGICRSPAQAIEHRFPLDSARVLSLVADTVIRHCQHELDWQRQLAQEWDHEELDSTSVAMLGLRICDQLKIQYHSTRCFAVLAGCGGLAEIMIIDSATYTLQQTAFMNAATLWMGLTGVSDITGDSIPEITVFVSSGSHGSYSIFASMYPDSLRLLHDETGNYEFFGPGGCVGVRDINGDGIDELLLYDMIWPDEKNPPRERYTVMRLRDGVFVKDTTIEVR